MRKIQKSAAPNLKYYYLARVCTTSGKPSTRLPLGRHVELKPPHLNIFLRNIFHFLTFFNISTFFDILLTNWTWLNFNFWSIIFLDISAIWNFNILYNFLMIHFSKSKFRNTLNMKPRWEKYRKALPPIWSTTTLHAYYSSSGRIFNSTSHPRP